MDTRYLVPLVILRNNARKRMKLSTKQLNQIICEVLEGLDEPSEQESVTGEAVSAIVQALVACLDQAEIEQSNDALVAARIEDVDSFAEEIADKVLSNDDLRFEIMKHARRLMMP